MARVAALEIVLEEIVDDAERRVPRVAGEDLVPVRIAHPLHQDLGEDPAEVGRDRQVGRVEVLSGIVKSQKVVVEGIVRVRDGIPVDVVDVRDGGS